jgi:hypothetical protein
MKQPVCCIQIGDLEDLVTKSPDLAPPETVKAFRLSEAFVAFRALLKVEICGRPYDSERDGCHSADPWNRLELVEWRIQNASEMTEFLNQRFGGLLHVHSRDRERQQQLNYLVICESAQSALLEPHPQSLAMTKIVGGTLFHHTGRRTREMFL